MRSKCLTSKKIRGPSAALRKLKKIITRGS